MSGVGIELSTEHARSPFDPPFRTGRTFVFEARCQDIAHSLHTLDERAAPAIITAVIVSILIICVLLIASACFSGSESALFSLPWWKAQQYRYDPRPSRRLIAEVVSQPRRLLITLLISNTLVNTASSSLAERTLEALFPGEGLWIAIIVMTIVLLIVGEVTPKLLAMNWPGPASVIAAFLVRRAGLLLSPIRRVVELLMDRLFPGSRDFSSGGPAFQEQFLNVVDEAVQGKILNPLEQEVIERIFRMEQQTVSQIMTPRIQIFGLPESISSDDASQALFERDFRRVPLYRGSLDSITGVLYAKDLLAARFGLTLQRIPKQLAQDPHFVPATLSVRQLYQDLKSNRIHLAIVLDEYGGTSGLVTLDDILRAVFKPVTLSVNPTVPSRDDQAVIRVAWDIEKDDLERMGIPIDADFRTLNGFLIDHFGHVPHPGESIRANGWKMTVIEGTDARVTTVDIVRDQTEQRDD